MTLLKSKLLLILLSLVIVVSHPVMAKQQEENFEDQIAALVTGFFLEGMAIPEFCRKAEPLYRCELRNSKILNYCYHTKSTC